MNPTQTPYRDWASAYWEAGWRGVLPLPPGQKWPPPEGFTGAAGAWPSYADVHAWAEENPAANIGIRLPPDVIALDVDTYGNKQGEATMAKATAAYGELPVTFCVTARVPGTGSGIFLYRVPPGLRWPGEVGPHVEIIQTRHRYMVAPPSVHPDLGTPYQVYGYLPDRPFPRPADLPELPEAWVTGLALTPRAGGADVEKGDVTDADVAAWLRARENLDQPCRVMFSRLGRVQDELVTGSGSRHDIALRGLMAFAHLSREGHRGASRVTGILAAMWLEMVTAAGDGQRSWDAAQAEWGRMLSGAVAMSHAYGDPGQPADPCDTASAASLVGAALPSPVQQSGTQAPSAPLSAPPGQGGDDNVPPEWVTGEMPETPVVHQITDVPTFDRHAVAVALEVERLEVRRDARLELARAEHLASWRIPPGYSLRELLALPDEPLAWRVGDVMPEGSNVLLAAQYKTGKTTLMNELTRSLADGEDFLGSFKVAPGNVAIFNYEVGQAQYARWLRDRGIRNADSVHVLNLRGFTVPLSVPLVRDWICRWLMERHISVWIVDPFARAFSGHGDENQNADVAPFLEMLDEIKELSGVTELVLPTHTGRQEFAIGAERARGATRLDDWCDVRWILTKDDEGHRYFRASGRDVETEETRLEFDPLTRGLVLGSGSRPPKAGRGGGRGDYGAQNGARGVSDGEMADVVLEVLGDEPGASVRQIREGVRSRGIGARNDRIAHAVKVLRQNGRIRVEGIRSTTGGRPAERHWIVGETQSDE